ncbi:hypothetical protein LB577_28665 [Mesorhizobium sp. B283B1A]|uniref:hypothetical protein n=1 Tax=Mesorhizobium TaxID=68287 RepID=UPI001CD05759|nr:MULTISPECIES: hypothetical protein [Mesorhizobium]MCA0050882.1 hypothetical protein [Mesorhizobium sp. B283B1A]UQS64608.1 hypothetical protein M5D98_31940 [Mesorhizobium opportunistum]
MTFNWRWDFTWEILPQLLWATLNTLIAAGVGYAIALVGGLLLALAPLDDRLQDPEIVFRRG